jgi:hypothetical protein
MRVYPGEGSIAVNKDGIVAITWLESWGRQWRIAFSSDGGRHFGASAPINPYIESTPSLNEALSGHIEPLSQGVFRFGAPEQLSNGLDQVDSRQWAAHLIRGNSLAAAPDGSFYVLWAAGGSLADELHATRITFSGEESPLQSERRKTVEAATCCLKPHGEVALYFTSDDYDPATHQFEVGVVLARKRSYGGEWPLVIRLRSAKSAFGPLSAMNADNDLHGAGAAWVLTGPGTDLPASAAAADIRLLPANEYDYSSPRILRFRLDKDISKLQWGRVKMDDAERYAIRAGVASFGLDLLSVK